MGFSLRTWAVAASCTFQLLTMSTSWAADDRLHDQTLWLNMPVSLALDTGTVSKNITVAIYFAPDGTAFITFESDKSGSRGLVMPPGQRDGHIETSEYGYNVDIDLDRDLDMFQLAYGYWPLVPSLGTNDSVHFVLHVPKDDTPCSPWVGKSSYAAHVYKGTANYVEVPSSIGTVTCKLYPGRPFLH